MADQTDDQNKVNVEDPTLETDANQADDSQGQEQPKEELVSKKELERLQKQLDKERMEKNMLRNKTKKLEGRVLETDDLESIKEAYAELAKEKEEREATEKEREQREEADSFRKKVITEYPETVQKAAQKLIDGNTNNLTWDNATDWNDAGSQLRKQLNALQEVVGTGEVETDTDGEVHPNNPSRSTGQKRFEDMSVEEMRKVLPHAEPR